MNFHILSTAVGQHLPLRHIGSMKLASNLLVSVPEQETGSKSMPVLRSLGSAVIAKAAKLNNIFTLPYGVNSDQWKNGRILSVLQASLNLSCCPSWCCLRTVAKATTIASDQSNLFACPSNQYHLSQNTAACAILFSVAMPRRQISSSNMQQFIIIDES